MPRLRVLVTCPGFVPGQVIDATPEQAEQLLADGRAELIRGAALEQAWDLIAADREEGRRAVRPR